MQTNEIAVREHTNLVAEQVIDVYYVRARESLWLHSRVTEEMVAGAAQGALGISATFDEIQIVAERVRDFMRGAGRYAE